MLQRDTFKPKYRKVYGLIVLYIIIGLLVADIGAPRRNRKEVVPQMMQPIENLFGEIQPNRNNLWPDISENDITGFFTNEKDIVFRRVKTIWGISEQSSTSSSQTTKKKLDMRKDILALAHVTYLAFWIAIDFRVLYLVFSIFKKEEADIYSLYFNEMYFAFHEFRGKLTDMVSQLQKEIKDNREREAIQKIPMLTLDFILDTDTLDAKVLDNMPTGITSIVGWSLFANPYNINGKDYKTVFPSTDYVHQYYTGTYNVENDETMETLYTVLYSTVFLRINLIPAEHMMETFTQLLLKGVRTSDNSFWVTSYKTQFFVKQRMVLMLANEFPVNPQAENIDRMSNAIAIMKKIRHMHFTVMYIEKQ